MRIDDIEYIEVNGGLSLDKCYSNEKDIVIPATIQGKKVVNISDEAFCNRSSLVSITIPSSVTNIGGSAFACCSNLISITIPNSITNINDYTFYHCSKLTDIVIPNNITSIRYGAFEGCYNLTNVTIPSSVTSISDDAFYCCTSLANITIPNSVTNIGQFAFRHCSSLKSKKTNIKATNGKMQCRGMQYKIGKIYQEEDVKLCIKGFHYCENAFDLFSYYYGEINKDVRFFEVQVDDATEEKEDDSKRVCGKIKFTREITSYAELLAQ